MSVQITTAFVNQFKSNVELLSQQKGSRLRGAVRVETLNGEYGYFEQIGAVVAQPKLSRHADTPQYDTPHARRRVGMVDYAWADYIDKEDRIRTLIDPTSPYAVNAVNAFGRAMDDVIIAAMTGTAYTGVAGATSTTLPSGQKVAVGTSNLSIAKLISAKEIFWGNDVDEDEELFIAVTGSQLAALLATTEVTSSDYNTVKALVKGEIDTFLGFKFIRSERVSAVSTVRYCPAWAKSGVLLAVGSDIKTRIDERKDKQYLTQVFVSMSIGATRMEEAKVVEIACSEA